MKNKISLLVIYRDNKTSADCALRRGKNEKNYIYRLQYKAKFDYNWCKLNNFFLLWRIDPIPGHDLPLRGFAVTAIGHTTLGRTSPDEWSALRIDLYLITHNTHKRQTSIRTRNPSKRVAADPRRRPRGQWDRRSNIWNLKINLLPHTEHSVHL